MQEAGTIIAGDGCSIAFKWDGVASQPVLVLSNSIATNHHMWDNVVAELSRGRRVLRYDTRGHGQSGAPVGAYSLDRLGRDVLELLDALGIERVDFCGLSLGGMVGQWLGTYAPDRVDRLVLSNTAPYLGPAGQWDALIANLLDKRDMDAMADMFISNWFPASFIASRRETVDRFRAMILSTSPQGLAGCFAVVRDMDLRRTNSLIQAPTLVLGGSGDTVTLPSHSEEIAKSVPDAKLTLLPGVHMLNVELPSEFLAAVNDFLFDEKP
jgi:3-oxoadipate enol-lactonase